MSEKDIKETVSQSNDVKSTSNKPSKSKTGTNTPTKSRTSKTTSKIDQNTSETKTPSKVTNINSKPKKLTLAEINRASSKFNEKRKVYLCDGQYEVFIIENFRRTDIQSVAADYMVALQSLQSLKGIDQQAIMGASNLIYTLIMKYFSDLPIPSNMDDIGKLIQVSNNLIDLGITEELFGGGKNSFKQSEIELVNKQISKGLENMDKMLGEMGLMSEINKEEQSRVDVDDYFSTLELRNFEILEDEDLDMLLKVMDQMDIDGTHEKYMGMLTGEEFELINKRLKLISEQKFGKGEDVGE